MILSSLHRNPYSLSIDFLSIIYEKISAECPNHLDLLPLCVLSIDRRPNSRFKDMYIPNFLGNINDNWGLVWHDFH